MNKYDWNNLDALLRKLKREDFGDMPYFVAGEWSRANLDSLHEDVLVKLEATA